MLDRALNDRLQRPLQALARFLSCLARLPLDNDAFKVASASE